MPALSAAYSLQRALSDLRLCMDNEDAFRITEGTGMCACGGGGGGEF